MDGFLIDEPALPEGAGLPPGTVVCLVAKTDAVDVTADGLERLATALLAPAELDFFRALDAIPSRRQEWLAGRAAAKAAVRRHLHACRGLAATPAEIAIRPDQRGKPHAHGAWGAAAGRGVAISIAHSRGVAAAVAWDDAGGPAGIDIERPRRLSDSLIARAFTPEELAAGGGRENALACWCMKEAVAKTTGRGIFPTLAEAVIAGPARIRTAMETFAVPVLRHGDAVIAIACRVTHPATR